MIVRNCMKVEIEVDVEFDTRAKAGLNGERKRSGMLNWE